MFFLIFILIYKENLKYYNFMLLNFRDNSIFYIWKINNLIFSRKKEEKFISISSIGINSNHSMDFDPFQTFFESASKLIDSKNKVSTPRSVSFSSISSRGMTPGNIS